MERCKVDRGIDLDLSEVRHQATETMPADACQYFYDCKGCGARLSLSRATAVCSAPRLRAGRLFGNAKPLTP